MDQEIDYYTEFKIFAEFFIEAFLILITIQLVSDKVDNSKIHWIKDAKISLLIAIILYIAKCINAEASENIKQGLHYAISSAFLAKYNL